MYVFPAFWKRRPGVWKEPARRSESAAHAGSQQHVALCPRRDSGAFRCIGIIGHHLPDRGQAATPRRRSPPLSPRAHVATPGPCRPTVLGGDGAITCRILLTTHRTPRQVSAPHVLAAGVHELVDSFWKTWRAIESAQPMAREVGSIQPTVDRTEHSRMDDNSLGDLIV